MLVEKVKPFVEHHVQVSLVTELGKCMKALTSCEFNDFSGAHVLVVQSAPKLESVALNVNAHVDPSFIEVISQESGDK